MPTLNEEENIEQLIRSIHNNNYRPIEIVVVDGGSKDRTAEIAETLKEELENHVFKIKILEDKAAGYSSSPANARNFGVINSSGRYILLLNADAVLTDGKLLNKLSEALIKQSAVWFRFKTMVDSWLEYNIVLDYGTHPLLALAFRREAFDKVMFDPNLGYGEDLDFIFRLRKCGIINNETKVIDTEMGLHEPHTLREFTIQRFWHGRTVWPFLRKYPRSILGTLLIPVGPFGLLFLAFVAAFVDFKASIICTIPLAIAIIYLFIKSPIKNLGRLAYIIFKLTWLSFVRTMGVLKGLYEYISGSTKPGRGI